MKGIKSSSAALSVFGVLLLFVAFCFGILGTEGRQPPLGPAVVSLGFALAGGLCMLGGAILTAVQAFRNTGVK